ncbi:MAG: hypothetical protein JXB49_18620 [Bacteroidales bacterium]|nr:hypothetical protein [Bacteroidales bacterium]
MYYNRKISDSFSKHIEDDGSLRWLFKYVKNHKELDFLIGKNNSTEWISVYRGLTRLLTIHPTDNTETIRISADKKYKNMSPQMYEIKSIHNNFQKDIQSLITLIEKNPKFDRYYKNEKEGYYQNELSRRYGIFSTPKDDFVIIDKEAVIGYSTQNEKDEIFGRTQMKYKLLQKEISNFNSKRYGKNLQNKAIGNELDFLALDKKGNLLLIEYKHGTNTSGIYLSSLQIGLYYDIFTHYPVNKLEEAVFDMLVQKQKIGLINPDWPKPDSLKKLIPVLVISEFNKRSSAKEKFDEILRFTRNKLGKDFLKNLRIYNYTLRTGLSKL